MRKLLIAAAALSLTACGPDYAYTRPESAKRVCAPEPDRPVGLGAEYTAADGTVRRAVTDDENGTYLRDLRGAGQDCREKLNYVNDWFDVLDKKKVR